MLVLAGLQVRTDISFLALVTPYTLINFCQVTVDSPKSRNPFSNLADPLPSSLRALVGLFAAANDAGIRQCNHAGSHTGYPIFTVSRAGQQNALTYEFNVPSSESSYQKGPRDTLYAEEVFSETPPLAMGLTGTNLLSKSLAVSSLTTLFT